MIITEKFINEYVALFLMTKSLSSPQEAYSLESISGLMQAYRRGGYDSIVGRCVRLEEGLLFEYQIELPTDHMPREMSLSDVQRLLQIEQAYDQFTSSFTLHAAGIGSGCIAFTLPLKGDHARRFCQELRSLELLTQLALSPNETQRISYIPLIVEGTIKHPPSHLLGRIYLNAERVSFGTLNVFL